MLIEEGKLNRGLSERSPEQKQTTRHLLRGGSERSPGRQPFLFIFLPFPGVCVGTIVTCMHIWGDCLALAPKTQLNAQELTTKTVDVLTGKKKLVRLYPRAIPRTSFIFQLVLGRSHWDTGRKADGVCIWYFN